ncbi:putative transposase, Ptta/En/Spm, plant [Sesbania bispinosa]|nr:putative transposase, Ptta/En/Spm, plant [Sesbania bispinosa]
MGKKWREYRLRLYNNYYDPTKSRDEHISNPPLSILATEWASFLDYRSAEGTKAICKKNAQNRSKLTINHTGGSKKLKRKRVEIMVETGQPVSRGTLYIHTHKRSDGTYINEEAQAVCGMEFVQHKCLDPATYDSVLLLLVLQIPGGHSSSQSDTNQ